MPVSLLKQMVSMVSLLAPASQTASTHVCSRNSRQERTPIIHHNAMSLTVATADQTDRGAQRVGTQMGTYQHRSCCGGPLLWSTCQQYSSTCSHLELQGRHLCEGPPAHRSHILVNVSNLSGRALAVLAASLCKSCMLTLRKPNAILRRSPLVRRLRCR